MKKLAYGACLPKSGPDFDYNHGHYFEGCPLLNKIVVWCNVCYFPCKMHAFRTVGFCGRKGLRYLQLSCCDLKPGSDKIDFMNWGFLSSSTITILALLETSRNFLQKVFSTILRSCASIPINLKILSFILDFFKFSFFLILLMFHFKNIPFFVYFLLSNFNFLIKMIYNFHDFSNKILIFCYKNFCFF